MYFTDQSTNEIFKSNKNCSSVEVHKKRQANGPGHIDVSVVGDEVMVTECGNEGTIMVYDKNLNYVRKTSGESRKKFTRLSSDSSHNLYVITLEKSRVQILSNDGVFLGSLGCDENGVKKLRSPRGICVAGQYVYVADVGMAKIVVFTTDGAYVTSFASGSYCSAVCVDQDGFVYACDFMLNKVCIY